MRHINAGTIRIGNATPEYISVPDLSKDEADVVPFHEDPVCSISDECSGSCVCSPFDHRACVRRAAVPRQPLLIATQYPLSIIPDYKR
ncbi:putative secreted protein [Granulibacter bethesdensis CGDNIH4]|nr:putative secreted protein [Granulibacter bethesdensis CGDNIH4]